MSQPSNKVLASIYALAPSKNVSLWMLYWTESFVSGKRHAMDDGSSLKKSSVRKMNWSQNNTFFTTQPWPIAVLEALYETAKNWDHLSSSSFPIVRVCFKETLTPNPANFHPVANWGLNLAGLHGARTSSFLSMWSLWHLIWHRLHSSAKGGLIMFHRGLAQASHVVGKW